MNTLVVSPPHDPVHIAILDAIHGGVLVHACQCLLHVSSCVNKQVDKIS